MSVEITERGIDREWNVPAYKVKGSGISKENIGNLKDYLENPKRCNKIWFPQGNELKINKIENSYTFEAELLFTPELDEIYLNEIKDLLTNKKTLDEVLDS